MTALGPSPPHNSSLSATKPTLHPPNEAIADTGCTGHYLTIEANLQDITPTSNPVTVHLADNRTIQSTHEGQIPFPLTTLPKAATKAHLFPALGKTSLISIGQLCDHGCEAVFDQHTVTIKHNNQVVLQGKRDATTHGLWTLPIDAPPPQALHAVNFNASPADLVKLAHAALFSPAISTLKRALAKGYLPPFPGLTQETLNRHTPVSEATIKGHLAGKRKNLNSTKPNAVLETPEQKLQDLLDDCFPPPPEDGQRTNLCYFTICEPKEEVHTDLTGRFPVPSQTGMQYLFVLYHYD